MSAAATRAADIPDGGAKVRTFALFRSASICNSLTMTTVCLTGGIATGKSSFLALFADGDPEIEVFDCDATVHELLADPGWAGRLAEDFGPSILKPDGGVDRSRLRPMVFDDDAARRRVEALLHPEVRRRCRAAQARAAAQNRVRLFLIEVPLLYESGFDVSREYEIVLGASPATQRRRLHHHRGLDHEVVERILAVQWPILEKVRRAHLVVWNEGSIPCLKRQALCLKRHPWLLP
jgi:dephospho-CoA kinase